MRSRFWSRMSAPAAAVVAAAIALGACSSEDDDRLARLEEELAELRGDTAGEADGGDAEEVTEADSADDNGATDDTDDAGDEQNGPAEPRVIEVDETQTNGDNDDIVATVERVVVHDYHVEIEFTALNNHTEDTFRMWRGSIWAPLLFDDQDRRFEYQHAAGYDDTDFIELAPGQRVEAVLMFGGRIHPAAQTLTLRFTENAPALEGLEWTVPLGGAE
jgi:hypothetical protein